MDQLGIIVGYAKNRVIGKDGTLPWREPQDLKHFKRVTMGHAIVMGRVCYESIGRPLPGRRNVVISRNRDFKAPGCEVAHSLEAALRTAREHDACPFVIGGAKIYDLAMPLATRLEITEIDLEVEGDVWFSPLPADAGWREVHVAKSLDARLTFRTLVRRLG